ncbi:hypothetical protein BaRGS_00024001, partial [Batillaria attramentaria]
QFKNLMAASSYLTPTPWSMDDSKYIKMDGASCIKMDKLNATAEYHNTQLRENTVYTNAPPDLDNEPDGAAAGTEPPNNYEKLQLYENTRDTCRRTGWFGPDCVYRCHCAYDTACDQICGRCTFGGCVKGFVGPACQYNDLAYNQTTSSKYRLLHGDAGDAIDANRATCFVTARAENSTWSVKLKEASWVNTVSVFVVTSSARADQLEVSLHNDDDDIHVVATPQVTKPNATRRNIALRKNATQGEQTRGIAVASRAVDGNTDGDFAQRSCTHTEDMHDSRILGWFRVNVTYDNGSTEQVYRYSGRTPPPFTDIHMQKPTVGTELTVWHYKPDRILALCEVEVYGDCLDGYFGWLCAAECRCENPDEICDKVWGTCPVSSCLTGWRGDGCQLECLNGTYGYKCQFNCSATCRDHVCHHVTGECTDGCAPEWEGDLCKEMCQPTVFGQNCSEACPPNCLDTRCHNVTGLCKEGCESGWMGDNCTEPCGRGFHGLNCSSNCSADCANNACDATSGECTEGCVTGRTGIHCEQLIGIDQNGDKNDDLLVGSVSGILALMTISGLAVWLRSSQPFAVRIDSDGYGIVDVTEDGAYYTERVAFRRNLPPPPLERNLDTTASSAKEERKSPTPHRSVPRQREEKNEDASDQMAEFHLDDFLQAWQLDTAVEQAMRREKFVTKAALLGMTEEDIDSLGLRRGDRAAVWAAAFGLQRNRGGGPLLVQRTPSMKQELGRPHLDSPHQLLHDVGGFDRDDGDTESDSSVSTSPSVDGAGYIRMDKHTAAGREGSPTTLRKHDSPKS